MKIIRVNESDFDDLKHFACNCFDGIESKTKLSKDEKTIKAMNIKSMALNVGKGVLTLNNSLKIILQKG